MAEVIIKDQLEGDLIFDTGLCSKITARFFTKYESLVRDAIPDGFPFSISEEPPHKLSGKSMMSSISIDVGKVPVLPLISDIVWLRGEHPNKFEPICDDLSVCPYDVDGRHIVGTLRISLKCFEHVLARL